MLLTSLTPDERRTIYADAFLLWRRAEEDWSPPPYDGGQDCECELCAPFERKPQRGTEAWRKAMYHQHRLRKRGKR